MSVTLPRVQMPGPIASSYRAVESVV